MPRLPEHARRVIDILHQAWPERNLAPDELPVLLYVLAQRRSHRTTVRIVATWLGRPSVELDQLLSQARLPSQRPAAEAVERVRQRLAACGLLE